MASSFPGWFIPARGGMPGPGIVLIHGWESARDRTLPNAAFLHAAGFHCLTFDVRGHGANPAGDLPVSAGEFGLDGLAAFRALIARPEVTSGAIVGHSMGAIGALLAGAADERVAAIVATSTPADPFRLRARLPLARLPIPEPIAYPLAWLTTRVYLRPRGHRVADDVGDEALRHRPVPGAVLLAHGDDDAVVPFVHMGRLLCRAAARAAGHRAQTLEVLAGAHPGCTGLPDYAGGRSRGSWRALGGPLHPERGGDRAAAMTPGGARCRLGGPLLGDR